MLDALKFVQGSVNSKDLVPALAHFCIRDNRITGFNGRLALSAPLAVDLECYPRAKDFYNAVRACESTVELHVTASQRLSVRSDNFQAFIEQVPAESYPAIAPEGVRVELKGNILPALRLLYDITCEDVSRPWAASVLFDGGTVMTTNNIVLAQYWLGHHFPYRISIPRYAVAEMIRIGEEPLFVQLTSHSATMHYAGERWLRTQLVSPQWPDILPLLESVSTQEAQDIPEGFFDALETLMPFIAADGRVYLMDDCVSTAEVEGASVVVKGLRKSGAYNVHMLRILQGAVSSAAFAAHPKPAAIFGPQLRGAIIGMRV